MTPKHLLSILLISILTLGLASCSKDKKIENQLKKKDGVWNIDEVQWVTTEQIFFPFSQTVLLGTSYNVGTFTFDEDGGGSYDYTVNGKQRTGIFGYSVENEEVAIIKVEQGLFPFYQSTTVYVGESTGKKTFYLDGSETYQDTARQFVFAGEFYLSR